MTKYNFTAYFLLSTIVAAIALAPLRTQADTKYWDINGSTPGSGQGTAPAQWNTTGAVWSTDSNGLASATTFVTGDLAVYSAGTDATNAFNVTVPNALTTGGLTIEEGTITITGAAVTIATNSLTINSGAKLTFPGSSTFLGTNGKVVLNGGTIESTNTGFGGSFVSPGLTMILNGGGTLSYTAVGSTALTIIQVGTPGTTISGTGPLIKAGAGVLAIATTGNTWTGGTIITNGELRIRTSNNTLPTNTAVTLTSPGILNLNNLSQAVASLTGNGIVGLGNGTLTVGGDNSSTNFTGSIVDVSSGTNSGVTSGTGKVTKIGSGTWTLGGSNGYSGATSVSQGTLALGAGGTIGGSAVTVSSGATLANATTNNATIGTTNGVIPGSLTLNSGALVSFTAAGGAPTSIGKIGVGGNITLNNNTNLINVTGSALAAGSYRLLECGGTLSGSAKTTATIAGTPLTSGLSASISTTAGATGHVDLVVSSTPVSITSLTNLGNGTALINFAGGISGSNYLIQAATNLAPPVTWTTVSTNTAAPDGTFQFNDVNSTNFAARYYRTAKP